METFLKYFQLIVSVLLIISVLMQSRTTGFQAANLASGSTIQTKRRGAEKVLFNATIVLAILFVLTSLIFIFV